MLKFIKGRILAYILPIGVMMLLISVTGTLVADVLTNVYIGGIDTVLTFGGNNTSLYETITLRLYNATNLTGYVGNRNILAGSGYGDPIGLVATAFSAQAQRTRVTITTTGSRIISIAQNDQPDDIAGAVNGVNSAVEGVQDTADGIYSQTLGISGQVLGVRDKLGYYNLTTDAHLLNQDITLEKILKAVSRKPIGTTPGNN